MRVKDLGFETTNLIMMQVIVSIIPKIAKDSKRQFVDEEVEARFQENFKDWVKMSGKVFQDLCIE